MFVLAGLVLLAVLPVIAQNTRNGSKLEVKFSSPTAFYAGGKKMRAGNYTVTQGAGSQANTMLTRGAGKNETYLEYQASVSQTPVTKTEVTFNLKWFAPNGGIPNWTDERQKSFACLISGHTEPDLFILFNADTRSIDFAIPALPTSKIWRLAVDASRSAPDDLQSNTLWRNS